MDFNTQICTTREQSERLLAMGLKPETSDMYVTNMSKKGMSYTDDWQIGSISYTDACRFWKEKGLKIEDTAWEIVPAWSLHRLLYMMPFNIYKCGGNMNFKLLPPFGDGVGYEKSRIHEAEDAVHFADSQNLFDNIISCYQFLIKNGRINESYLTKNT